MFQCLPDFAWADGNLADWLVRWERGWNSEIKVNPTRSTSTWDALYNPHARKIFLQYKSVIAWDLGLEQIHPISDFAL